MFATFVSADMARLAAESNGCCMESPVSPFVGSCRRTGRRLSGAAAGHDEAAEETEEVHRGAHRRRWRFSAVV